MIIEPACKYEVGDLVQPSRKWHNLKTYPQILIIVEKGARLPEHKDQDFYCCYHQIDQVFSYYVDDELKGLDE